MVNEYVEILTRHVAENPPNYGSDANSILEMLFTYYHECNNTDTDAVKVPSRFMRKIVCRLRLNEVSRQ